MGEYEPNDTRRVTLNPADKKPGKRPDKGWHEAEREEGEDREGYEPDDSRNVTLDPSDRQAGKRAEPGWHEKEHGR